MNAGTEHLILRGEAGAIDVALDLPPGVPRAIAVIAHPHPLFGGTRDNKVVQTLARAMLASGCICWRPNFRGVGGSAGAFDEGRGETEDLLAVIAFARQHVSAGATDLPLVLGGFSFGGFVQTRVASQLTARGAAPRLVLVAPAVSRFVADPVPEGSLIIHGEQDDLVPMAAILDWARPQNLPVVVIPGAEHFFHGRLPVLRRIVEDGLGGRLRAAASPAA